MDCGGALTAINSSPDDSHCVVGGRDLLKIFALNQEGGSALLEKKNLRAGRKKTLDLSTSDARWHPLLPNIIATASTTGAILLWDLLKPKGGGGDAAFRHERTVNRISWHPSESSWLISCSQDSTVKLWDARCAPVEGTVHGGAASVFTYRYDPGVSRSLGALRPGGCSWASAAVAVRDVQVLSMNTCSRRAQATFSLFSSTMKCSFSLFTRSPSPRAAMMGRAHCGTFDVQELKHTHHSVHIVASS